MVPLHVCNHFCLGTHCICISSPVYSYSLTVSSNSQTVFGTYILAYSKILGYKNLMFDDFKNLSLKPTQYTSCMHWLQQPITLTNCCYPCTCFVKPYLVVYMYYEHSQGFSLYCISTSLGYKFQIATHVIAKRESV